MLIFLPSSGGGHLSKKGKKVMKVQSVGFLCLLVSMLITEDIFHISSYVQVGIGLGIVAATTITSIVILNK